MNQISIALLGFGNVGRAFARLLLEKEAQIRQEYKTEIIITGIQTGRHGAAINSAGIPISRALEVIENGEDLQILSESNLTDMSVESFLYSCSSQFLLESTPLNPYDGQPALSYLKMALESGKHVITANKGPVVFGYRELTALASERGKGWMFESAVMDGAPIFSLFRETLPVINLNRVTGILNSCTNYLLDLQARGVSFADAVQSAQEIGITETDPSFDIDGWDAAIKLAAISTVLFDIPLKPHQVERQGIRDITVAELEEAAMAGEKWKLVCSASRKNKQLLYARVRPERVKSSSPFYNINGTSSYIQFETDVLPALGITETDPGPQTTAYGMLADLFSILKKYSH